MNLNDLVLQYICFFKGQIQDDNREEMFLIVHYLNTGSC